MNKVAKVSLAGVLGLAVLAGAGASANAWGGGGHWGGGGPGGCRDRDTPLTTAQVRDIIEGKIAWKGEDVTVGKVEQAADGTIRAEIAKPDGTVARVVTVDPKTGRFRRGE